ncbi:MAG: hypothetical protein Q8P52_03345 [bacterium]|nr:hypothetical protein [bacterium]
MDPNKINQNSKTNWVIAVIVAFLLGLGLGALLWAGDRNSEITDLTTERESDNSNVPDTNSQNTTSNETGGLDVLIEGGSVSMPDEDGVLNRIIGVSNQTFGTSVMVDSVLLQAPGWVTVREDSNGTPGNILGARWLPAGSFTDVEVKLLRGTESGNKYYVVIYTDNGNKIFEHKVDTLLLNSDKQIVGATFLAL